MKNTVIIAESLGKKYNIGLQQPKYHLMSENISNFFKNFLSGDVLKRKLQKDNFIWALKNVSFEVKQGEIIGVIGRNGAGKSTLLKLLSRIIEPSYGKAKILGRSGSLLEVGTGFHEELTGRENIFLNGSILGMKNREIKEKFDEIVDFSGVGKFLDTPVKYYSSGMYVRLAFAIAAYFLPEILLIDEVLAVGDVGFRKKCFGKMDEVVRQGRSILFVSHDMAVVSSLCSRAILLDEGRIIASGDTEEVVAVYLGAIHKLADTQLNKRLDRQGDGRMRCVRYWLENHRGEHIEFLRTGEEALICIEYISILQKSINNLSVAIALKDKFGNQIADLANRVSQDIWEEAPPNGIMRCKINRLPLVPGSYRFNIFASIDGIITDYILDAGKFEVETGSFFKNGKLPQEGHGVILIDHTWDIV